MIVCTTFPDWAWDVYARDFLESYVAFWKYPIHVYIDQPPSLQHPLITYHADFSEQRELSAFRASCKPSEDYRKDAGRFAYKVFAQLDAIQRDPKLLWLDADIVTFAKPDYEWLEQTWNDYPLTILGRKQGHCESGFVMFNAEFPIMTGFINLYRMMYTHQLIFNLHGWTDCHAIDFLRRGLQCCDLSPQSRGVDHVWPHTKLAEWCNHKKGQRKFGRDYLYA